MKRKTVSEMIEKALSCYCMKCATCLDESSYNATNYGGKRFVAMLTNKAELVVMRNHYNCSWCGYGLDIRDATPEITDNGKGGLSSVYHCPTCQKRNRLKLYKQTNDVMKQTRDDYYALGVEYERKERKV